MFKGCEMRKFIIAEDGELRIGGFCEHRPYLHKELLYGDKTCYGGGYVYIIPKEKTMLFFSESIDFGEPQFDKWKTMENDAADWKYIYKKRLEDEYERVLDTSHIEFWD